MTRSTVLRWVWFVVCVALAVAAGCATPVHVTWSAHAGSWSRSGTLVLRLEPAAVGGDLVARDEPPAERPTTPEQAEREAPALSITWPEVALSPPAWPRSAPDPRQLPIWPEVVDAPAPAPPAPRPSAPPRPAEAVAAPVAPPRLPEPLAPPPRAPEPVAPPAEPRRATSSEEAAMLVAIVALAVGTLAVPCFLAAGAVTRRLRLLALLAATLAPSGCYTLHAWELASRSGFGPPPVTSPPVAVRATAAVRAGDGSYHVLATYTDGRTRRIVVAPLEAAPAQGDTWPEPARCWPDIPGVTTDLTLPPGVPLRCRGQEPGEAAPDHAVGVLVGHEPGQGEGEVLAIEAGELRLFARDRPPRTLAVLRPQPASRPLPVAAPLSYRLGSVVGLLALTPVLLGLDLAAGVASVATLGTLAPLFASLVP